jgi:RNA polymerase sigma factor (sigma-70 family)
MAAQIATCLGIAPDQVNVKAKTAEKLGPVGEERSIEDFGDQDEEDTIEDEAAEEVLDLKPADVINAMQKLTPAYRTVFNLYVFEEMTHKEIAEMLGINIGTSKSNLAKAKHNLKKLLKKEHKLP